MKTQTQQRRGFVLVAAIVIGIALLMLLAPLSHAGHGQDWLAILPILFVGIISPLSMFAPLATVYAGRAPEAPPLASRYQRPPPIGRG